MPAVSRCASVTVWVIASDWRAIAVLVLSEGADWCLDDQMPSSKRDSCCQPNRAANAATMPPADFATTSFPEVARRCLRRGSAIPSIAPNPAAQTNDKGCVSLECTNTRSRSTRSPVPRLEASSLRSAASISNRVEWRFISQCRSICLPIGGALQKKADGGSFLCNGTE